MASTQRNPVSFAPLVSVVIPLHNAEADLADLLNALAAQTYPHDRVEYLLVDNASRDRTAVLLQDAQAAMEQSPSSPTPFSLGEKGNQTELEVPAPLGEGFRVRAAVSTLDRLNLRLLSQLKIQSSYAARNIGI
ncbi:MAG: glycosyltransferase, partial [Microcoleus sp. SIO2G3]|nr:glycosyltransferase [Microcoleus sp. SIO2G3]